jgi:probable selenium-dependent hydroxylase accessory protein YqeC
MDSSVIKEVNKLWEGVYPYLAQYIMDLYGSQEGDVLELGPFSGGIAKGLLRLSPHWKIVIAGEGLEVFEPIKEQLNETGYQEMMRFKLSPLSSLVFLDQSFDLVISRGSFFFLSPFLLREAYRVLRAGGLAILGGGYGPYTPQAIIDEIAEKSKRLNQMLGKIWFKREDMARLIQETSLDVRAEISERGGLWVILRKEGEEVQGARNISLKEALSLKDHEIISLVGGGGKTTLLFALAEELNKTGLKVITTTTTKIFEPSRLQAPCLVIEGNNTRAMELIKEKLSTHAHVTFATNKFLDGKIGGVHPDVIVQLSQHLPVDHLVIEADGAKKLPIKAPADHEPVVPSSTTLLVPMVGIDAVGKPLVEEEAFRPGRIAELTGAKIGETINPSLIAILMTHPQGLIKGAPPGARIIPFINKVETMEDLNEARKVAHEVLRKGDRRIEKVVLGRLFYCHPIVEITRRNEKNERDL